MKRLGSWLIRDQELDGWYLAFSVLLLIELLGVLFSDTGSLWRHLGFTVWYVLVIVVMEVSVQRGRRRQRGPDKKLDDHK